jgi:hypothetical protein
VKGPANNEMKQTKPAVARMARASPLISVFGRPAAGLGLPGLTG